MSKRKLFISENTFNMFNEFALSRKLDMNSFADYCIQNTIKMVQAKEVEKVMEKIEKDNVNKESK